MFEPVQGLGPRKRTKYGDAVSYVDQIGILIVTS